MGDNSLLKALALATQLGFAVACPLVVFIAGGVWADGQLGTGHILFFVGLVLGLGSAASALYQIAVAGSSKSKGQVRRKTGGSSTDQGAEQGDAGTNPANDQRLKRP